MLVLEAVSLCFPVCLLRLGVGGPYIKKASGKVATVQLADEQMMSFFGVYIFFEWQESGYKVQTLSTSASNDWLKIKRSARIKHIYVVSKQLICHPLQQCI